MIRAKHSHYSSGDNVYLNIRLDNIYDNVPDNVNLGGHNGGVSTYHNPVGKNASISLSTGPILDSQSKYKCAIDFFNIRPNIPLFYFKVAEGINTDYNAGIYGVCLNHAASGTNYSQRLAFVTEQSAGAVTLKGTPRAPIDNGGLQDFATNPDYYAVRSFSQIMHMINTAFYTAWAAMVAAHAGTSYTGTDPACPPYVYYDESVGRVRFILHSDYIRSPKATIFVNAQLYDFMQSVPIQVQTGYYHTSDPETFTDYKIVTDGCRPYASPDGAFGLPQASYINSAPVAGDVPYLPWSISAGGSDFYVVSQEYESRYYYCNIRSIVFFTNLSVRPQFLPSANNPNGLKSSKATALSVANPAVCTVRNSFDLKEGDTVYLLGGGYSVDGTPVPTGLTIVRSYVARNVQNKSFALYNSDGTSVNVTASAITNLWAYRPISNKTGQFNSPSRTILAYFDIITSGGVDWRQNLYDSPSYRKWSDLIDSSPLNQIDIDIYIELVDGTLIPMTIASGDSIDIKLVFKKSG